MNPSQAEESGQVSLKLLLDFLVLCESSGFIEFKLPFRDLQTKLGSLWDTIFQDCAGSLSLSPPPCTNGSREEQVIDNTKSHDNRATISFSSLQSGSPPPDVSRTIGSCGESFYFSVQTPELPGSPSYPSLEGERQPLASTPNLGFNAGSVSVPNAVSNLESVSARERPTFTSTSHPLAGFQRQQSVYDVREGSSKESCSNHCSTAEDSERKMEEISLSFASDLSELCLKVPPFDGSSNDVTAAEEYKWGAVEWGAVEWGAVEWGGSINLERAHVQPTVCDGVDSEPRAVCSTGKNGVGSVSQPILVDSDDEADENLEKLFVQLKIESSKKRAPKHIPSRKSLAVFVVSDSEDVGSSGEEVESDGEEVKVESDVKEEDCYCLNENAPPHLPHTPWKVPSATSSCTTPYTGEVFWGSPGTDSTTAAKSTTQLRPTLKCTPLVDRNHVCLTTPVKANQTPLGAPRCGPNPTTTPSANKNFSRHKGEMVRELFELFNYTVFENKLPADLEIKWNNKLRTTAGYCYNLGFGMSRHARVELSSKVCDSYERIRATLIHELCHAATWIIDGIKGGGHGPHWKAWAHKANSIHPDLEPVTRCHGYSIAYKHIYKCTRCDHQIGRHSKSVNLHTDRCPYCLSALELLPRLKADGTPVVKRINRYAQFVKDNYAIVKLQSPWRNHKEIMQKLKEDYHKKDVVTADEPRVYSD